MENDEWVWANEPRPNRLAVYWDSDGAVIFEDRQDGQRVIVTFYPLLLNGRNPAENEPRKVGREQAERYVWHVITKNDGGVLRAGLTQHVRSYSSQPHEFEKRPMQGFEEVFLFLLPDGDKAILEGEGLWPNGEKVDAAWPVRDKQLAQVPMGHHRVVAMPGEDGIPCRVAYVWCYICDRPEWEKD